MKKLLKTALLVLTCSLTNMASLSAEQLSIERIYSSPSLNGKAPKSLKFSPDGTRVTYLQGKADDLHSYDLWEYNLLSKENKLLVDARQVFSGEQVLSDEEKARRERQRIYGFGIIEYMFSHDGSALLFPLNGDIYYYNLVDKSVKRLTQTATFETDIKFSPRGNYVSFIREQNIYILNIKTAKESQLTLDGKGLIQNGMADHVAQESINRDTGYWWSPDEKHIAFLRVDQSPVQKVIRNEIYAEKITLIEQRYPATGTNNVKVSLATVKIKNSKIRNVDLGKETDIYIARVNWLPGGEQLSYQWQSRDQKSLKLKLYDLKSRDQRTLVHEKSDRWVNLNKDLRFLTSSKTFIWASERDGYKHLYRFNLKGELIARLTQGDWVVDKLESIDEKNG